MINTSTIANLELEKTTVDVAASNSKEQQQKKENFLGSKLQHKNHKLYEVDKNTLEFTEATFEKVDYVVGQSKPNRKILIKPNCFYVSALNKKNMQNKINKIKQ